MALRVLVTVPWAFSKMPYKDKAKWKAYNDRRRQVNTQALREMKSHPCLDCGKTYPPEVMEFDHVPERGKKKVSISTLKGTRKLTAKTFKEELAKCDLVCANCHKLRTHKRAVEQQAARLAHNQEVDGSIPSGATKVPRRRPR